MSEKEKNILKKSFFDFPIIRLPDQNSSNIIATGSNQKKLLIVCEEEEDHSANLNLLEKILEAVKYKLDRDCSLICLRPNQAFSFSALNQQTTFENVLVFGPIARKLGLNFEIEGYYPLQHNESRFLFASALSVIANDRAHKGALWTALKEMFL